MKKKYMIPEVEVVTVKTQQLIATSPLIGNDYSGSTILSREDDSIDLLLGE